MAIESWLNPEDAADLAAHASAMIDAALVGTDLARDAYWAAVRKGYNTPYNDPPRRKPAAVETIPVILGEAAPAAAPALVAPPTLVAPEMIAAVQQATALVV